MERDQQIQEWLVKILETEAISITSASSDASFRRYFRVEFTQESTQPSLVLMDAPPNKEDTGPFVKVATILAEAGLNVPLIKAQDAAAGFLLLTDLGNVQYQTELNPDSVDKLYDDALDALLRMQVNAAADSNVVPLYDHALLMREMELFREWYVQKHLGFSLTAEQNSGLDAVFETLAQSALLQPQVFVHRDYHSRNLMVTPVNNPGVLDFQDAVVGAISYDLVSLLRDCYISWPRERVEKWALDYFHHCMEKGMIPSTPDTQLLQWLDWMGVQRHLKASGIFARLNHRDGKPGYLEDIPRTLGYVSEVTARYPQLAVLNKLLNELPDDNQSVTS